MAVRRATRTWTDLAAFLEDLNGSLAAGAVLLPAGTVDGELAPEVKLDFVVPVIGRVGPISAQVVHRGADGSVALRLPELEAEGAALKRLPEAIELIRVHLLDTGALVLPTKTADLARRLAEAEARIVALEAELATGGGGGRRGGAEGETAPARSASSPERRGRGFAVPDLQGVAPALEGKLGDRSFRDAIVQLAVERVGGLFTIHTADGRVRYGFWDKGGPVAWRTDPVQEAEVLGVLLLKANQITQEQLSESLELMKLHGIRQGEAFIQMNVLTFTQLIMVLGKQVEFLLQRVMAEKEGSWTFHPLEQHTEQFLPPPLKVPSLLFRALLQRAAEFRSEVLVNAHKPNLDSYVYVAPDVKPILDDIRMQPVEKKFLEVLQSTAWRLRELFSVSPMSRNQTASMVWVMNELGFLVYDARQDVQRYLAEVGLLIQRKKAQLNKATHFDALEVHWISTPEEVEAGFKKLDTEFNPSSFHDLTPELAADLQHISKRVREAHAVLKDDNSRREYRKKIIEGFMIVQSAELLARKGEMAIMRKDRREAVTCFLKALELVPGGAEYREGLRRSQEVMAS